MEPGILFDVRRAQLALHFHFHVQSGHGMSVLSGFLEFQGSLQRSSAVEGVLRARVSFLAAYCSSEDLDD